MTDFLTEDVVRNMAKDKLNLISSEKAVSDVGQLTTFNVLSKTMNIPEFEGISDKPDGWYLPYNNNETAIIVEAKNSEMNLDIAKFVDEIRKNCTIAMKHYKNVVGILYNGYETRVFLNNKPMDSPNELQDKDFYINRLKDVPIDKNKIFLLTKSINDNLHFNFGIKNLYHRMIFTASALVAYRYNKRSLPKDLEFNIFKASISSQLAASLESSRNQNEKITTIVEIFDSIIPNQEPSNKNINAFIDDVIEISNSVNSNHWDGEDVMAIFFNEFNRYKGKSESGQVFTPDHIASFMYKVIGINKDSRILDAACGSGTFLVKAMSKMINEAGGVDTEKAKRIKSSQLYGIEFDREIFSLACANMLIHKDGKTNLKLLNSREKEAGEFIKASKINKVLMNPPFENKYGWDEIVLNVLNNVEAGSKCAFILPDKKLEKKKGFFNKAKKKHKLEMIIKLPENTFFNVGVTASIFIFTTGIPQNNDEIFAINIAEDGLETIKNQGRQDVKNKWVDIEAYWLDVIKKKVDSKYNTVQWLNPDEHLSWQEPILPFEISMSDFNKTLLDFEMFKEGIDKKEFSEDLLNKVLYQSEVSMDDENVVITL